MTIVLSFPLSLLTLLIKSWGTWGVNFLVLAFYTPIVFTPCLLSSVQRAHCTEQMKSSCWCWSIEDSNIYKLPPSIQHKRSLSKCGGERSSHREWKKASNDILRTGRNPKGGIETNWDAILLGSKSNSTVFLLPVGPTHLLCIELYKLSEHFALLQSSDTFWYPIAYFICVLYSRSEAMTA